jgi:vacuolar-type H+-ATPase subunit E/Vma4
MTSEEESIQALTRTVEEQANADAAQILADAKSQAEAVKRRSREEASAQRKQILDRATRESETLRAQATASARMQARTNLLERREEMFGELFAEAQKRLASIQDRPEYGRIVRRLVREALPHLAAETVVVRADKRTLSLMTDEWLETASKENGVRIQLGEELAEGTGVIVETADGHRQFDNTLETRLERMRDRLRAPVYRILTGEAR